MSAEFTDEQVGKRVVTQAGSELGTVDSVRDGVLYVEVGPAADAETIDQLGWAGTVNQAVHKLPHEYVSNISEQTVRLRI